MSIYVSIGTSTANSYISVASADEYFDTRENSDAWIDISSNSTGTLSATTRKENLLIQATRELDGTYRFHDQKYNQGIRGQDDYQNLEFPRSQNTDVDNDLFIPEDVEDATCEQALWITQRTGKRTTTEGEVVENPFIGIESNNYIKSWINRQVMPVGRYSWQGSNF